MLKIKNKRILSAVLATAMLCGSAAVFTGCQNGGSDTSRTQNENSTESSKSSVSDISSEAGEVSNTTVNSAKDFEYTIENDEVTITKYTGYDTDVIFPDTIEGKSVTKITGETEPGWEQSIFLSNQIDKIKSVKIPDTVKTIGDYTFFNCKSLTDIDIPSSVTEIGSSAFKLCTSLKNINIPSSVVKVGGIAFFNTPWYDNQPDGLVYTGSVVYKYKGDMPENTSITIKDGTVGISSSAFYDYDELTSITLPDSISYIEELAFSGCKSLESIIIPDNVTFIGLEAFSRCSSLSNVIIPDGVTEIAKEAFAYCEGLESITIPPSVTTFGDNVFDECPLLTIKGKSGSAAEKYAKENNIPFKAE